MAIKPSLYPDWTVNTDGTDNDVVDPTSGENNVVEPSAGKKLTGWDYKEKPPRNYFNWLHRLTTQWVRWFDQEVDNLELGGREFISGLFALVPVADPDHTEISVGVCRSTDDTDFIQLTSNFQKDATANWVAGGGNGGFPSGLTLTNNTYYNVFVIKNPTTGDVDAGFDFEIDASNLLADATGFTLYRRVGLLLWLTTDFDRLYKEINSDSYYLRVPRSETLNLNTVSGGVLSSSALGPTKTDCSMIVSASAPTLDGVYGIISDNVFAAPTVITPSESYHDIGSNTTGGGGVKTSITRKLVLNNLSGNFGEVVFNFNIDPASGTITAYFHGWIDHRKIT